MGRYRVPPLKIKLLPRVKKTRLTIRSDVNVKSSKPVIIPKQVKSIRPHKIIRNVRPRPSVSSVCYVPPQPIDNFLSNGIGVGVLSFNRLHSLQRLIYSIRKFTDLRSTSIIVSDESTDKSVPEWLLKQPDLTVIVAKQHGGIVHNTNRLLKALEEFDYKLILNDDVEILQKGWDSFYFELMKKTDYHHFCYREIGICGARHNDGMVRDTGNCTIWTIQEKPQGAVLAFDKLAHNMVGYYDVSFGKYGMSHVDWSNRVGLSGIQPIGFHDIIGSSSYFKTIAETSASRYKSNLSAAKNKYNAVKGNKNRIKIIATVEEPKIIKGIGETITGG